MMNSEIWHFLKITFFILKHVWSKPHLGERKGLILFILVVVFSSATFCMSMVLGDIVDCSQIN